jgi:S-layer protein
VVNGFAKTIAAGATTGTFTITPTDDGVVEGFEAFKVSVLNSSFNAVASTTPIVIIDGAPAVNPVTLTLTAGIDTGAAFTGTTKGDTFIANNSANSGITLTTLDSIDGGDGIDTMAITLSSNNIDTTTSSSYTVKNIEIANLVAAAGTVTANTTAWTGLTDLSTNGVGAQTVTAASTTNISVGAATVGTSVIAVQGGKDVTVTASGVTTGTTTVGAVATAPTGGVSVNVTGVHAPAAAGSAAVNLTLGAITAVGGSSISVTQSSGITAAQNATALTAVNNGTITLGAVGVTGTASTTDVTVNQSAAVAAVNTGSGTANKIGVTDGAVTVNDVNKISTTAAGTISTVSLTNYANSNIYSSALTTVNLSGTAGTLGIDRGDLAAVPTANTITINLNGLSDTISTNNTITDNEAASDDGFTTVNINGNNNASTVTNIVFADATTVNIGGSKLITFTAQTFANATAINVTNSAGVVLGTQLPVATAFTGGAGVDTLTVGATTKNINTGAGDDVVTVSVSALATATATTTAGSIDGGDGVDTLSIAASDAVTASNTTTFSGTISGFERLAVANVAATGEIKLNNLDNINYVTVASVGGGAILTLSGATTGSTVKFTNGTQTATVVTLGTNDSSADALDVNLSHTSATTLTALTTSGFETVNFLTDDSATTVTNFSHIVSGLTDTSLKTLTVSGDAGLALGSAYTGTTLTLFNASGVTAGAGVTFTAANLAAAATITGGATADTLNAAAAATDVVTLNGNGGNDTLTGSATKSSTINGGTGDDILKGGAAADSIDGGDGIDTYVFSSALVAEQAGSGTTLGAVINLGSTALSTSAVYAATNAYLAVGAPSVASNTSTYLFSNESATNASIIDTFANIENVTGTDLADYIVGSSVANTITGGTGADVLDGGLGIDTFNIAAGDSAVSLANTGGNNDLGTVTGYDKIVSFALAGGDVLNVAGTGAVAVNATATTDSTLTIAGAVISSIKITSGAVVFSAANDGTSPITINSSAKLAAAIEALTLNDIGGEGDTTYFVATIGGSTDTYVYTQSGAGAGGDIIDLVGVTGTSLITSGTTAGGVYIA